METNGTSSAEFIPWDSQDLGKWTDLYAIGETISLGGHITHYMKKGEGPPLILIHGFFGHSLVWRLNFEELSKHFTVYAPDLWGLGYSSREPLDYGWELYSKQIKLFMDSMGIQKAHLGGLSMGGGIATQFTNNFPDMVDKLFFVGPAVFPQEKKIKDGIFSWPVVGPMVLNLKTDKIRKTVMLEKFLSDSKFLTDEGYKATTWHHKIKGSTNFFCTALRAGFIGNQVEGVNELSKKHKSILIIWGGQDKACSVKNAKEMNSLLKGSQLEVFENAGHLPNLEEPERFNGKVLDFLLND